MPEISDHYKARQPSGIRVAQLEFEHRKDGVEAVNVAIGNVILPMHPALKKRLDSIKDSPFKDGVVPYSSSIGLKETREAFLNVIASSGFKTEGLHVQITDGGSMAMEFIILGASGHFNGKERPLLLIDASYTNYGSLAERTRRKTVSITRHLHDHGKFSLPEISEIEQVIEKHRPAGMVVIPYDNPTGHFYDHKTMVKLAKVCVKFDMWMVSDEAYRELYYTDHDTSSIWGLTDKEVPGIEGRRISIETSSKVWNACGLRIGALVTDNKEFHDKAVAESTANLCAPIIDQWIFGALAHVSHDKLRAWYHKQRAYYKTMLHRFTDDLKKRLPGVIISSPDASIYSVVDVRNLVDKGFNALDFVMWCTMESKVAIDGKDYTLLVAPMAGFYNVEKGEPNPGRTQMRIAYVEPPDRMELVSRLFSELFNEYVRHHEKNN
ncbi:MAG: aminotransferase class I/II-fold pyridoxal phosphate-dependent enzyme [Nanoarchaeota archaeon]|nr:aminotransferase class I/II-fold pyridoxal phosphate-dependent enzyme [Nanoarchaeota archaeon]